jgi:hypothetical protein
MSEEDVTDEVAAANAKLILLPVTGSAKSVRFSNDVADESAQILARSRSQLKSKGRGRGRPRKEQPGPIVLPELLDRNKRDEGVETTRRSARSRTGASKYNIQAESRSSTGHNTSATRATQHVSKERAPTKSSTHASSSNAVWSDDEIALLKMMRIEGESWDQIKAVNQSDVVYIPSFSHEFCRPFLRDRCHH